MIKQSIISGLIAGIFYTLFMWIGDSFFFNNVSPFYIYLIQGAIFTVAMSIVYYFIYNKRNKQNKK